MTSLKASWQVFAGVIPELPMPEYTKSWYYTSDLYEQDKHPAPEAITNNFTRMMNEAHDYARQITDPARVNWVKVEFIWL